MRKVEMINIMIILGVMKEEDRNYLMRKTIESLFKIYTATVPVRIEYLNSTKKVVKEKRNGNDGIRIR